MPKRAISKLRMNLFRKSMREIGLDLPKSEIINSFNIQKSFKKLAYLIIRPSFTLGGSGVVYKRIKNFYLIKSGLMNLQDKF